VCLFVRTAHDRIVFSKDVLFLLAYDLVGSENILPEFAQASCAIMSQILPILSCRDQTSASIARLRQLVYAKKQVMRAIEMEAHWVFSYHLLEHDPKVLRRQSASPSNDNYLTERVMGIYVARPSNRISQAKSIMMQVLFPHSDSLS
jgi:hypothetical protein